MKLEKIFITGASGCIGHYILDQFIHDPNYELHLLIRDPSRLKIQYQEFPNITIHIGEIEHIETQSQVLAEMDYVIHIATAWGDSDEACVVNQIKTLELFNACHPDHCKKIIYFSTASILGKNNTPIPQAGTLGTGYVRSKYKAYHTIKEAKLYDRIVTVFPTLVFGGDKNHPYSHISSGITPQNAKFLKILRFLYMDARFHFLHAYDIAQVVKYLLTHPTDQKDYVLGNPVMTGKETLTTLCQHFNIPIYFRIPISGHILKFLAGLFRIKVGSWDRFCIENPYFEYNVVNPKTFGLDSKYSSLTSVLPDIKN